jgi:hypothetical protein
MAVGKNSYHDTFFEIEYRKHRNVNDDTEIEVNLHNAFKLTTSFIDWVKFYENEGMSWIQSKSYYDFVTSSTAIAINHNSYRVAEFENYAFIFSTLAITWKTDLARIILTIPTVKPVYFYLSLLYLERKLIKDEFEVFKAITEDMLHEAMKPILEDIKQDYIASRQKEKENISYPFDYARI